MKRKIKVLMLSWEYPPRIIGGLSRAVEGLSLGLVKNNVDVSVLTLQHPYCKEYEKIKGVKIIRAKPYYIERDNFANWVSEFNFTFLEMALHYIKRNSLPDIIHCHDWLCAYASFVISNGYKKPLIATIHATEHGRNQGIYTDLQRYIHTVEANLTQKAKKVITCSNFMKEEVINVFSLPENKVITIPNGIDKNKYKIIFDKISFRRNYARDNEKIIFYVGRMVREKGVEVLIDAIPQVLKSEPDAKFLIVGGGNTEHLKQKVSNLGIWEKVYFTGYVDDETLSKIYNIIDVAVFPSLYEPFGIVALESMAAKVPVVTSNIGGFLEIIQPDVDGVHTQAGDPISLAEGIIKILKNNDLAEKLKENGWKKVSSIYNWEKIAEKTKDVYEEVIVNAKFER